LFSIAGIIATSDVDASAGRLPYVFYHTCTSIQGAMLVIMVVTINKYLIDALKSKGANKDSKDMFYMMKQASVVIVITFEVLFVILENLIESEVGVVNGTVQGEREDHSLDGWYNRENFRDCCTNITHRSLHSRMSPSQHFATSSPA